MHFNLSEERKMLKESCDRLLNDHYTQYKNLFQRQSTANNLQLFESTNRQLIKQKLAKQNFLIILFAYFELCLLYTSPSPRDVEESRMPASA